MFKYNTAFLGSLSFLLFASASVTQMAFAHEDDHIRRSGLAYIAQSTIDMVTTTVGSTGPLSPQGWPVLEVTYPSMSFPGLSADISSAMTQGTYNGSNSEAHLTNLSFQFPTSPELYLRAAELNVQAFAYCDGSKAVVFGMTDLDEAALTNGSSVPVLATGKISQQVPLPSGVTGSLILNEQFITGSYSYKKIVIHGAHYSNSGFDLILGHVEADVKCPYDLSSRSVQ